MPDWFDISSDDFSQLSETEQQELVAAKNLDYFDVFYKTDKGRKVLLDIQKYCYGRFGDLTNMKDGNCKAALALIEFYQNLRGNCGLDEESEAAVLAAEATIAVKTG